MKKRNNGKFVKKRQQPLAGSADLLAGFGFAALAAKDALAQDSERLEERVLANAELTSALDVEEQAAQVVTDAEAALASDSGAEVAALAGAGDELSQFVADLEAQLLQEGAQDAGAGDETLKLALADGEAENAESAVPQGAEVGKQAAGEVDAEAILQEQPTAFGFAIPVIAPFLGAGVAAGAAAAGYSGNGNGGGSAGGPKATSVSGTVVDGPVKGATVFYDANGNGVLDDGEESVVTGANGKFSFSYHKTASGHLVSIGGTDIYSGKAVGFLMAPEGATVITPLTTLLVAGAKEAEIKAALGIDPRIDLTKYDPYAVLLDPTASPEAILQAQQIAEISQKLFAVISAAAANLAGEGAVTLADVETIAAAVAAVIHNAGKNVSLEYLVEASTIAAVAASEGLDYKGLLNQIHAGADLSSYFTDEKSKALVNAIVGATKNINFSDLNAALHGDAAALEAIKHEVGAAQEALINVVKKIAGNDTALINILSHGGNGVQIDKILEAFGHGNGAVSTVEIDLPDGTIALTEAEAQALIAKRVHFADDDDHVTLNAAGPTLNITVAALQGLGVDAVNAATSQLSATLGDANLGGKLPHFADALTVTLGVTDDQVADALTSAHAGALAAAGVDVIHAADGTLTVTADQFVAAENAHLTFAQNDVVTLSASASEFTHLNGAAGIPVSQLQAMHVDVVDLTGSGTLQLDDGDAQQIISASIHFAADDDITVHAAGTVLSTSVAGLQALGVDSVTADHGALHVGLGDGTKLDSALPHFADALNVTLGVSDNQVGDVLTAAHAGALASVGVDVVHAIDGTLTVNADQLLAAGNAHLTFAESDVVTLNASASELDHLYTTVPNAIQELHNLHVDVIDVSGNGNLELTDVQAAGFVAASIHFAADDNIVVHAAGTVLSTSVAGLQALGVDSVTADHGVLHVGLGNDANLDAALPHFADSLNVTLGVADGQVANALTTDHAQALHDAGIDHIHAIDGTLTVNADEFAAAEHARLTFAKPDVVTLNASVDQISHLGSVVDHPGDVLKAMHVDVLDLTDPSLTISDSVAQEILSSGVHFAANDQIHLHAEGTVLNTSLHDMQKLGVDTVDGVQNGKLHIDLGTDVTLDQVAHEALPNFDTTTHTTVDLKVHVEQLAGTTVADIVALENSGVDKISLVDAHDHVVASASIAGVNETTTAFEVTDELAAVLVNAGLITAPIDPVKAVDVDIVANNGESALSLLMMGDLGVDHVSSTSADVLVHLGFNPTTHQDADLNDLVAALAKLGDGAHSVFDTADNVTLDFGSNAHFIDLSADEEHKLKLLGIDKVNSDGQTHNLS